MIAISGTRVPKTRTRSPPAGVRFQRHPDRTDARPRHRGRPACVGCLWEAWPPTPAEFSDSPWPSVSPSSGCCCCWPGARAVDHLDLIAGLVPHRCRHRGHVDLLCQLSCSRLSPSRTIDLCRVTRQSGERAQREQRAGTATSPVRRLTTGARGIVRGRRLAFSARGRRRVRQSGRRGGVVGRGGPRGVVRARPSARKRRRGPAVVRALRDRGVRLVIPPVDLRLLRCSVDPQDPPRTRVV